MSRHPLLCLLAAAACAAFSPAAHAAEILINYSFGDSPTHPTAGPSILYGDLTASDISTLNGTPITFNTASFNSFSSAPDPSTTGFYNASGVATNNGFAFTVTVPVGEAIDISAISFFTKAASAGPATTTLLLNGSAVGTIINPTSVNLTNNIFNTAFTDLTGTLTFHLVGGGDAAGGGTPTADGNLRIDDFRIQGSLHPALATPAPEAASAALLTFAALPLLRRRRRAC